MMTPAQMNDLYSALTDADAGSDAETLARIGWQLYSELSGAQAATESLRIRLASIAAAAAQAEDEQAGPCPRCGDRDSAGTCVFCGQPVDPSCGHGLEYTPTADGTPGRWRCAGCGARIAEETEVPA